MKASHLFVSARVACVAAFLILPRSVCDGADLPDAPLPNSQFVVRVSDGAVTGLKRKQDAFDTEYLAGRLGDLVVKYRQSGSNWHAAATADLAARGAVNAVWNAAGNVYSADYQISNENGAMLGLQSRFGFERAGEMVWTISLTNLTAQSLEVGDLALPLPMNTKFTKPDSCVFKHSLVSGNNSLHFWMRPNSVGPYLTMTTLENTALEYWDAPGRNYEVYIHSAAAGAVAAGKGTKWRQANTSLTLPPGGAQTYGLKFRWAKNYDGVRQVQVEEGKLDTRIVPGMTVPTNLTAKFAFRTTQPIEGIDAEFPTTTTIKSLEKNGDYRIYEVQFARFGENKLTVRYGNRQQTIFEFFVTEPLETLINKRSAFIVSKQVNDPSKWYDGLYAEWNMDSQTLLTPDNYDHITGFQRYEIASDDPALSRPAYMGAKIAVHPVQSEVASLDHYIKRFVWGGLQCTTKEPYSYAIYGVRDWHTNRNSPNLGKDGRQHFWRVYDYPHIIVMYYGMYQVAKHHPEIKTELTADEYLQRAYGTAKAMFTVPKAIADWSGYYTGYYNELVIPQLIDELERAGWKRKAAALRKHWDTKVKTFVAGDVDLFQSEYSFDSTGFESTQALADYALKHAATMDTTNPAAFTRQANRFLVEQMQANLFCRGWLEPAYYYYGSDYRGGGGDAYLLSYMAQMGGWAVLDYGLHYATNATDYLQLGYASVLSSWALMNSGTPESNYGYWFPGVENDGGCGGGFEPSPYNRTWLGQPAHRGSWYYSCEENLGYCGALRAAATILSDDPIFGRVCYGGSWTNTAAGFSVLPKDGVRRRFHAMLDAGKLHMELDNDNFSAVQPLVVATNLSSVCFTVETLNPKKHTARLRFTPAAGGNYTLSRNGETVMKLTLKAGMEQVIDLRLKAHTTSASFTLSR